MTEKAEPKPARVFVGLKIATEIAERLAALAVPLREVRARLVAPADIHLTLVPPWQEAAIDQAVERLRDASGGFAPFPLQFLHVGYGPQPRRPHLLWADCAATDDIAAFRTALMTAFGQEDSRPFRPHVTLARLRQNERHAVRTFPIDRPLDLAQIVDHVELFQSPPPGAVGYRVVASIPLAAPA